MAKVKGDISFEQLEAMAEFASHKEWKVIEEMVSRKLLDILRQIKLIPTKDPQYLALEKARLDGQHEALVSLKKDFREASAKLNKMIDKGG